MTKDEALRMAIEVLEAFERGCDIDDYFMDTKRAIQACKEALAQPAQEPIHNCPNCNSLFTTEIHSIPAPAWQSLSDDEIRKMWLETDNISWIAYKENSRAIEAKLMEKNG
jgi:hypothetical protein